MLFVLLPSLEGLGGQEKLVDFLNFPISPNILSRPSASGATQGSRNHFFSSSCLKFHIIYLTCMAHLQQIRKSICRAQIARSTEKFDLYFSIWPPLLHHIQVPWLTNFRGGVASTCLASFWNNSGTVRKQHLYNNSSCMHIATAPTQNSVTQPLINNN